MADEVKKVDTAETESATTDTSTDTGTSTSTTSSRVDEINKMYDANIASKTTQLESDRDTALSEAQANKDKLASTYNEKRNNIAAEYERQRRNNNLQAQANGLNTGAASQMQLGQMNAYQNSTTDMNKAQADQESEADRNMATIRQQYSSEIAKAASDNDFERMSALYQEGVRAEEQARNDAGVMASFGDFSGYVTIYGQEVADQMLKTWCYQNPDIAYTMGKISADEYYKLTGRYPNGYSAPSYGGGGGYYGGYYGGSYGSAGSEIVGTSSSSDADPQQSTHMGNTSIISPVQKETSSTSSSSKSTSSGNGWTVAHSAAEVAPATSHNYIADAYNAVKSAVSNAVSRANSTGTDWSKVW